MELDLFLLKLKSKFNYENKVITALEKIIPKIILYYGEKYEELLEKSLLDCTIINCNSKETINMVKTEKSKIQEKKDKSLISDNLSFIGGIYYSSPDLFYDTNLNSYVIKSVKRYIIISHTYNLDSARGIAILTHNICHLMKSYNNEYKLQDNILIKRCGLKYEKYLLKTNDNDITIDLINDYNTGLEEGINSYDEEEILKLILNDNYETFDYQNTKYIATCLKDRLKLKNIIEEAEFTGDIESFIERYGIDEFDTLSSLADSSCELEDKKNNYDITKEELKSINNEINYLIPKIVDNMVIYLNKIY